MGLFGKGSQSIEKIEAKADAALAHGEPLEAYRQYREAARKLSVGDAAAARLREKAAAAHAAFREQRLREVEAYLADAIPSAALETLEILRDHLEAGGEAFAGRLRALETRAREMMENPATVKVDPERLDATPHLEGAAVAEPPEEREEPGLEAIDTSIDPHELFEQFSGALPPEDVERARALGSSFQQAFVRSQLGDARSALALLEQASREHPEDALVLEHLAVALDQLGRGAEAEPLFRRSLELDPQRMNARIALASILGSPPSPAASGRVAGAGDSAVAAFSLTPQGLPRDLDGALSLLEEGVARDAERAPFYCTAAVDVALKAGRSETALVWARRGMEAGAAQMPDGWITLATALEATGALDEAERAHEAAVRMAGHAILPRARFAEFALRTGHALPKAQEIIFETCMTCQAAAPSPETLAYYGMLLTRIQFARGLYKEARDGARRLLAQDPPRELAEEMKRLVQAATEALARQ